MIASPIENQEDTEEEERSGFSVSRKERETVDLVSKRKTKSSRQLRLQEKAASPYYVPKKGARGDFNEHQKKDPPRNLRKAP